MTKKEQSMRLYQAVERLALQAGEDTDETIDWLCGEHGGMAKLFGSHFSPKSKPLTDEQIHEIYDAVARQEPYMGAVTRRNIVRAIEAAHGIKE